MAASMGNRRQPGNSEVEQQEQETGLRSRLRRNRQKQPFEQEVTRTPLPPSPSQLRLRKTALRSRPTVLNSIRSSFEQPKPLNSKQTRVRPVFFARTPVQPLQPNSETAPGQPSITPNRTTPLPNFSRQDTRVREFGYTTEKQTSSSTPAVHNPWQVKPKSPLSGVPASNGGSQTPQSLDGVRGNQKRDRTAYSTRGKRVEPLVSQPSKLPVNAGKRRQGKNRSQSPARATSANRGGNTNTRRIKSTTIPPTPPTRTAPRPRKRPVSPLLYIIRLLILGIGIGAIVGTLLSALDPSTQASVKVNKPIQNQVKETPKPIPPAATLALGQELLPLKDQMQALAANNLKLQPGVFIIDLETGAYIDLNSQSPFPAASTIKLPILVALFQDVDGGRVRLDETLTLQPEMIATGSGDLQYKKPGTSYTVLEVATKMIAISDNTATNMLIARLGGAEALNQRFRSWGLTATVLNNPLPDLEGTNLTSPQELANLMSIVNRGNIVSLPSRDRIIDIMQRNQIDNLLPKGLGEGAVIAHKTGNIGSMLADVGLVDMPTGKRYIISVMVKRPFNDPSAQEFIRQISQTAYEYFNQPRVSPSANSMPSRNPPTADNSLALDNYEN